MGQHPDSRPADDESGPAYGRADHRKAASIIRADITMFAKARAPVSPASRATRWTGAPTTPPLGVGPIGAYVAVSMGPDQGGPSLSGPERMPYSWRSDPQRERVGLHGSDTRVEGVAATSLDVNPSGRQVTFPK